jgi:hypothetical protein
MASTVNSLLQSVELARDKFNHAVQVLSPALSSTVVVAVSGTSVSGTLPTGTSIVRFASTANCHVVFGIGMAPTATTSDWLFPAGVELFTVPNGATHFAVIGAGGSTGTFSATKME